MNLWHNHERGEDATTILHHQPLCLWSQMKLWNQCNVVRFSFVSSLSVPGKPFTPHIKPDCLPILIVTDTTTLTAKLLKISEWSSSSMALVGYTLGKLKRWMTDWAWINLGIWTLIIIRAVPDLVIIVESVISLRIHYCPYINWMTKLDTHLYIAHTHART